jgi:ABC-type xylose transport system substrate-binding protein
MNWFFGLVAGAGVVAVVRIYYSVQKARNAHHTVDFDEQLIARLRKDGLDPFRPHSVDFFLALPNDAAALGLLAALQARGMSADKHATPDAADFPVSVHVSRQLQLTVGAIKALAAELGQLAQQHGGRYDGWAIGRAAS